MAFRKKKKQEQVTVSPMTEAPGRLRYEAANLQGIGSRARQEDSFTLANALDESVYDEKGLMFAVCDGMGGMKDGKLASETAIACFRRCFAALDVRGMIADQLEKSVYLASGEVEAQLEGDGGSTVVIGVILHEMLHYASVGDSFFYLMREGSLYRINSEHNVCHELYLESIRRGELDPAYCRRDPEADALSQFLGMPGLSEVDRSYRPIALQRGDILLACSDGVGGVLNTDEITEALAFHSCTDMAQRLEDMIIGHRKRGQDNYTAVIIKCV